MNNSSLLTADRTTHLKIVVVSLAASVAVMFVGIAARPGASDPTAMQTSAPVVKAGNAVIAAGSTTSTIR